MEEDNSITTRRSQTVSLEHQKFLSRILLKDRNNESVYEKMVAQYPEYTEANLSYDMGRIRLQGRELIQQDGKEILAREVDQRLAMLDIAWENYHAAKGEIERVEETKSKRGVDKEGRSIVVSSIETIRTKTSAISERYWWDQIVKLQDAIEKLLGLHHVNVNVSGRHEHVMKAYAVNPSRNWPNVPEDIIDGDIISES
jgi:hypothetical protein